MTTTYAPITRTAAWAVEGAGGLGHLLAQQLVAAGEPVLDLPPKLGGAGPAAGVGVDGQERPERRPVGRCGGAAVGALPAGAGR